MFLHVFATCLTKSEQLKGTDNENELQGSIFSSAAYILCPINPYALPHILGTKLRTISSENR
jgi:hypothetical protein